MTLRMGSTATARYRRAMHRRALALVLVAGIVVIAAALMTQYVGGLVPCELCLYERWPYYAGISVTALALLAFRVRPVAISLTAAVVLIYAASGALGFYHVGVERHWFEGPSACTSPTKQATTIDELRAQLLATQPVLCDQPQWSFHGLTLAGLNFIASLGLALASLYALREALRRGA
ncbi:MAG TPA: disulfide bond formation protein B [Stellaceae bacterium]|nr:disulfide bond formation protein B [Stellaceae bacterium]